MIMENIESGPKSTYRGFRAKGDVEDLLIQAKRVTKMSYTKIIEQCIRGCVESVIDSHQREDAERKSRLDRIQGNKKADHVRRDPPEPDPGKNPATQADEEYKKRDQT